MLGEYYIVGFVVEMLKCRVEIVSNVGNVALYFLLAGRVVPPNILFSISVFI